ncbi:hypothetical protein roselon_02781 [Roseibacterium elongatum DSM 19469]|uniref:Uncharacterized protein n=1 Tax=Roseicyclus elongatus DSM 19469 TaxID=1294273 RepID=W8RV50_9RHOB|nr:hypothetical protein roselon_02781 [Roseibacterium elongatum DSM 19469]
MPVRLRCCGGRASVVLRPRCCRLGSGPGTKGASARKPDGPDRVAAAHKAFGPRGQPWCRPWRARPSFYPAEKRSLSPGRG